MAHELIHLLGIEHTQFRKDRDRYVYYTVCCNLSQGSGVFESLGSSRVQNARYWQWEFWSALWIWIYNASVSVYNSSFNIWHCSQLKPSDKRRNSRQRSPIPISNGSKNLYHLLRLFKHKQILQLHRWDVKFVVVVGTSRCPSSFRIYL